MSSNIVKYIRRQDSGWKQAPGCSGETSINLSIEIFDFLTYGMVDCGEECGVTFKIYKEDYDDALNYIKSQLPLYRTTSRDYMKIDTDNALIDKLKKSIDSFFKDNESVDYTVTLNCRKDGRIYLKGLKQKGFTIRDYLVEFSSALIFTNSSEGFDLRLKSAVSEGEITI